MEKIEIYIGCKIITYSVPYATARAVRTLLKNAGHKTTERKNEEKLKEWERIEREGEE